MATRTKANSGQYIFEEITKVASAINCDLTIHWISGHSKVEGNEKVDELAKQAAQHTSSRTDELPMRLRKPLPVSASAEKQRYHKELLGKWDELWEDSPRKRRLEEIDGEFPFKQFRTAQDRLSRAQASRLFQIRCRHIQLNTYLHRIGKSDTRDCQQCNNTPGRDPVPETVNHYIFECPVYDNERRELEKVMGDRHCTLRRMMENKKGMKVLANYVLKTGRLRDAHT